MYIPNHSAGFGIFATYGTMFTLFFWSAHILCLQIANYPEFDSIAFLQILFMPYYHSWACDNFPTLRQAIMQQLENELRLKNVTKCRKGTNVEFNKMSGFKLVMQSFDQCPNSSYCYLIKEFYMWKSGIRVFDFWMEIRLENLWPDLVLT